MSTASQLRMYSEKRGSEQLKECYLALRQRVHELALDEGGRVVPEAELADVRAAVTGVWRDVFADVEDE